MVRCDYRLVRYKCSFFLWSAVCCLPCLLSGSARLSQINWPNCHDTSLIGFLEMFALQGKDFTCNAFLTQSNKVEAFGLQPAGKVVPMPACKCQKIARTNTGSRRLRKSPRVFVTLDLWMNLQPYGISAPRKGSLKTYFSIENNLSNKHLAIAKWKLQGDYFLTHIAMWKDVERCLGLHSCVIVQLAEIEC